MVSDLRTFLKEVESSGKLLRVKKEVNLDIVGALISQSDGPILFERIKGHPNWRLCDLFFKTRETQAMVLKTTPKNFVKELARRLRMGPRKTKLVSSGPVKDKVYKGDDVDLRKLPVPIHSERDPGPYITGIAICKDPDTGITNSCVPRTLVKGRNYAVTSVVTPHTWIIYKKYEERGEPMPFALFLGHHPCYELAANYSGLHLDQFGEIDLVGTFLDETVEMVKCETIDLEVPAHAEIVIEGYIPPKIREDEGPSPSPCLYYVPGVAKMPVFKVTAITMREDAIYRHMQSTTFTDHQVLPRLCHEAILYNRLREMGVKVHDVFFPPWGGALSVIIQMTNEFDGQVNDALMLAMGAPWLNTKFVIAVDEDINIYDPAEIYYALATRVDPSSDVIIVPRTRANPMDPSGTPIPHIASGSVRRVVGKWGIDATKPPAYKAERRAEFDRAWPKEWGKVFLKDFI